MIRNFQAGRYDWWRLGGDIEVHCLAFIETRAASQVKLPCVKKGGRLRTPLQQRMPVSTSHGIGTSQVGLLDSSLARLRLLGVLWLDPLPYLN